MIGKARLVSASPFRASVKVMSGPQKLNEESEDEDFQREELPAL